MSSLYVRNEIKSHIAANLPAENLIDLSGEYRNLQPMLSFYSLTPEDPFLGIQFVPSVEAPQAAASGNASGCYREFGAVYLHVVEPVEVDRTLKKIVHTENILTRAEAIVSLFPVTIEAYPPSN